MFCFVFPIIATMLTLLLLTLAMNPALCLVDLFQVSMLQTFVKPYYVKKKLVRLIKHGRFYLLCGSDFSNFIDFNFFAVPISAILIPIFMRFYAVQCSLFSSLILCSSGTVKPHRTALEAHRTA